MKNLVLILLAILMVSVSVLSQTITRLSDMPERVTNQAVAFAEVDGEGFVYSFAGLDSTKLFSGIHQKGFKYDVANDTWQEIDPLPSGNGRIAAGASLVKDKIYIIGGYEVFEDDSEISVDLVHVYDPATDTYLPDASPIPLAIDDHVQAVWRDSLIYVVTGWSNTTNVPNVQIYNPAEDEWTAGTPVPDNNTYKVFGSSGVAAYNYDGIAYNTGLGVNPYERILQLDPASNNLRETATSLPIMDNREVAQLDEKSIIICGGMSTGQQVSNTTYLLNVNFVNVVEQGMAREQNYFVYPTPSSELIFIDNGTIGLRYEIVSMRGLITKSGVYQKSGIPIGSLAAGLYFVNMMDIQGGIIPCGRFVKH